ncbi:hypothetical protein CPB85DRAFT_1262829 [Mucidula mucida]|nr:hypothetical protein CPB85DRAFT_1262829 [Mucidula mucida]
MAIPVATSELVGAFLEALGYGRHIPRRQPAVCQALRRKYASISTITLVYFSTTMFLTFLLITMHIVVDLTRTFRAFTSNLDVGGASELYFATVDTSLTWQRTPPTSRSIERTLFALEVVGTSHSAFAVWGGLRNVVWFTCRHFHRIWRIQKALNNYATLRLNNGTSALAIILESGEIAFPYGALVILFMVFVAAIYSVALFYHVLFLNSGSVFSYVILRSTMDTKRFDTTNISVGSRTA